MQSISASRTVQSKHQPHTRCKGDTAEQTTFSPAGITADCFLRHRFIPLYETDAHTPDGEQLEKGLFQSLELLKKQHALDLTDVTEKPFPYNLLLAYREAEEQICKRSNGKELFIIRDDVNEVKFATKETIFQKNTLYYIPVLPLYRLLRDPKQKKSAELLLSVCAYLCQVANLPHYRDADSYLGGNYEMLSEWLTDPYNDWEEEVITHNRSALYSAAHYGDIMLRRMYSRYNLELLSQRVASLKLSDQFGSECLKVGQLALDLYARYPDGFLFRHLKDGFNADSETDDDEEAYYERRDNTLMVKQYVHFIAEGEGSLYHELMEMLNNEFNEKQYAQEPNVVTLYDGNLSENPDSLDYERRLFELIDHLCDILFDLK